MALETYNAKRDFRKTSEPAGRVAKRPKAEAPLSFVIQKHDATRLHYDLRLEHEGVLWSWAVTRGPSLDPSEKRLAVHVEDHPLEYGSFEGTIPKGEYGAGAVIVWDRGTWVPESDPAKAMKKGHIAFELHGEKLSGRWHLVRLKPRSGEKRDNWLLIKSDDAAARPESDILAEQPNSVASGRSIEDVARGKGPTWTRAGGLSDEKLATAKKSAAKGKTGAKTKASARRGRTASSKLAFIPPCLATLKSQPPEGQEWLHEVKFDGYRLQAQISGGQVSLLTRTGLDWTKKFGTAITEALAALDCEDTILDGEIVVLGPDGASSFSRLQQALSSGRTDEMLFYLFDIMHLDGDDLRGLPLVERKHRLAELLQDSPGDSVLRYSDHFAEPGSTMLRHACRLGLEGVVSKRADAPYRSGRQFAWIKSKCTQRQEFVIVGYVPSDKGGRDIRSLVLGYHEDGKLRPAGRVGTGFTASVMDDLKRRFDRLETRQSAFSGAAARERKVVWLRPELVAEVEFRSWTHDGILRHASFQGLREDKPAEDVVEEKPADTEKAPPRARRAASASARPAEKSAVKTSVKLSSPTKALWPDEAKTKQDLLEHYALVWPRMRKFVVGRPLALVRAPDGIHGQRFFQKHASKGMHEAIRRASDPEDGEELLYIDNFDGLAALVQFGTVEIHVWGSTIEAIDTPDQIIFDLDPDEGLASDAVRAAALDLRSRLDELSFPSFVKASGGKGFHVVVPLKPAANWEEVKGFAHDFARALEQAEPDRYTATLSKKARKGRIFIDYLRNGRGSTAIAPYSSRAKKGATVSMPVRWEDVENGIEPNAFSLGANDTAARISDDDPWADFFRKAKALSFR